MNRKDEQTTQIKLVIVGDGNVGKTCMLLRFVYTTDKVPADYVPTVFDNYITQVQVDQKMIKLCLWDTAGQETYNRLRTLSYSSTDVFVVVFSLVEQSSFDNALEKVSQQLRRQWYPELNKDDLQEIPKLFVGNKLDIRQDDDPTHVSTQKAQETLGQQDIKYMECSALTQKGLKDVFDEAIRLALTHKVVNLNKQLIRTETALKDNEKARDSGSCCSIQ